MPIAKPHTAQSSLRHRQTSKTDAIAAAAATSKAAGDETHAQRKRLAGQLMQQGHFVWALDVLKLQEYDWHKKDYDALILDPGFVHLQGHHYNSNVFFRRLLQAHDLAVGVLRIDRDHPCFVDDLTQSQPAFPLSPYEQGLFGQVALPEQAEMLNQFFYQAFKRSPGDHCSQLLVVHTARHNFIDGLCKYIRESRQQFGKPTSVIIGVVEAELTANNNPHRDMALALYRQAFGRLHRLPGLEVLLFAETPEVVKFLSSCLAESIKVIQLPYVGGYLDECICARRVRPAKTPVIGYVGQSRPERGALMVQELVNRVLDHLGSTVQWRLQLDRGFVKRNLGDTGAAELDALANRDGVTLYPSNLPLSEYHSLLADIDIMVMPYSNRYDTTGSGIAVESLRLGHVLVVPQSSSMAALARYVGAGLVTFAETGIESVNTALLEAVKNFERFSADSLAARERWSTDLGRRFAELDAFIQAARTRPTGPSR